MEEKVTQESESTPLITPKVFLVLLAVGGIFALCHGCNSVVQELTCYEQAIQQLDSPKKTEMIGYYKGYLARRPFRWIAGIAGYPKIQLEDTPPLDSPLACSVHVRRFQKPER